MAIFNCYVSSPGDNHSELPVFSARFIHPKNPVTFSKAQGHQAKGTIRLRRLGFEKKRPEWMGFFPTFGGYPLAICYIAIKKMPFSIAMLNYQRLNFMNKNTVYFTTDCFFKRKLQPETHGFYHQIDLVFRFQFSHNPIL